MATKSKLKALPYKNKFGEDYHDLPISKARKRKIEHVKRLLKQGEWSRGRVRHYAIHGMNMCGSDVTAAFEDAQ